jgi:hypothetical protein
MTAFRTVFVLQHVREEGGSEDVKLLGVYSSRHSADDAVARLKHRPGFRDFPEGFHIDPYDLDVDHWSEGFGVPHPAV